jgi:hypothetical protein
MLDNTTLTDLLAKSWQRPLPDAEMSVITEIITG